MTDAKHRPDAEADHKPQNQTGEEKGSIKSPQVTDQEMQRKDLARGSEVENRKRSGNRN